MVATLTSSRTLLDPRGRCNRRGLLYVSSLLLAVELGLALIVLVADVPFDGPAALVVKLILLWTALVATSKRLHDCGRSAWWIAGTAFGLMGWCFLVTLGVVLLLGPPALAGTPMALGAVMTAVFLPLLSLAIWLHVARGDIEANQYGPVPDATGFSHLSAVSTEGVEDAPLTAN